MKQEWVRSLRAGAGGGQAAAQSRAASRAFLTRHFDFQGGKKHLLATQNHPHWPIELELERDMLLEICPRTCMNMQVELAAVADTCRCSEVCVVCEESEAHQSLRSKHGVIPFKLRLSIATQNCVAASTESVL